MRLLREYKVRENAGVRRALKNVTVKRQKIE